MSQVGYNNIACLYMVEMKMRKDLFLKDMDVNMIGSGNENEILRCKVFHETCRYNPGFPQDLFSKDSLKTRGAELVSKRK